MNDIPATPKVGQALAWAFQRLKEELRTVLILSVLLIVVFLVAVAPVIGFYAEILAGVLEGGLGPAQIESMDFPGLGLVFAVIVAIFGSSAIYVLFARLTDMDRGLLLEGGFAALMNRGLWVVWRLICASGWMMIVAAVLMIVIFIVAIPAAMVMAEGGSIVITIITVAIYVVMLVLFLGIYGALAVAIYAASRDIKIGILATWKALKGCRRRLVLANVVIYLLMIVFYVLIALLTGLLLPSLGAAAVVIYIALLSLVAGIYAFLWLSIGAAFSNYALSRS